MMSTARTAFLRTTAIGALALGMLLAACANPQVTPGGDDMGQPITGRWVSDEQGTPHLVLHEDGTVRGSDGCNGIASQYEVDGTTITVASFVSTLKGCPGVDTWLHGVRTLEPNGEEMAVFNSSGEQIGTLRYDGQ